MSIKITIFGYGFVGKAHENVLKHDHEITIVDPAYKLTDPGDPDAVIIAVSTPQSAHGGQCYMDNVYDALKKVPEDIPVLIKSTISLEGWDYIERNFNHDITFSPEFLRAATALEDFENAKTLYFGGGDDVFWASLLWKEGRRMFSRDPRELIMMKYCVNTFLATKVAFFNQIEELCDRAHIDYNNVKDLVQHDERIGNSHMDVTEQRGFGGHCFPKDTSALLKTASREYEYNLSILQAAVDYNLLTRDWSND